jgi:hypoxanthine phosphoribosyltransferase
MRFRHFRGTRPPRFAHPSEEELAELLDELGIPWEYEPHTFTLERSPDGTLRQAITPDFYLPDAGVYIELTAMKQSLVNRKNQKVRKLRERYGEVVTILYRRDLARLRRKYGLHEGRRPDAEPGASG